MSRHAPPPSSADAAPVPEPTFAERARTLVYQERTGSLATVSRKHPGHPFASLMPYGLDGEGRPLLLISALAVHTQNLHGDPRASLFVAQSAAGGEALAAARVTLMGRAARLSDGEVAAARQAYLARHEAAGYWADFEDFAFWRLEVNDVYFVGGFAAMGWVSIADYRAARPDPLADIAYEIMEHMNRDHSGALVEYARHFARAEAENAVMAGVDRLGFKLRLTQGDRRWSVRIAFPRSVSSADESRETLIAMLRQARSARDR
jgi:putative heme iron utilization protein